MIRLNDADLVQDGFWEEAVSRIPKTTAEPEEEEEEEETAAPDPDIPF